MTGVQTCALPICVILGSDHINPLTIRLMAVATACYFGQSQFSPLSKASRLDTQKLKSSFLDLKVLEAPEGHGKRAADEAQAHH